MNLLLQRDGGGPTFTNGRLYVNQVFECFTLEDTDRHLEKGGAKIPGKTAIPRGTYKVTIDFSNRFQKRMMRVLNVPQFEGIRIHAGNDSEDTDGCLLLGKVRGEGSVLNSRVAVDALFAKVEAAINGGESVVLEVR